MSRGLLTVTVALASYALFNLALSIVVAVIWRRSMQARVDESSSRRARTLTRLRSIPALAAATITAVAVVPAFAIFEPVGASEVAGPVILALAAIAIAQIAAALIVAAATTWRTRVVAGKWLRAGAPLHVDPPVGIPAYAIDSLAPIVALVGVFRPKLVAARSVINACTATEFNAIVAHERGHLSSRDNLKRWLMACAPDGLRWTPIHLEIAAAWHDAAEDAADDAATAGDANSRVDLAELLVKIARLAPSSPRREVTISPFVEPAGLNRRVRRLLDRDLSQQQRPGSQRLSTMWATTAVVAASLLAQPPVLERVYHAVEALIRFGR